MALNGPQSEKFHFIFHTRKYPARNSRAPESVLHQLVQKPLVPGAARLRAAHTKNAIVGSLSRPRIARIANFTLSSRPGHNCAFIPTVVVIRVTANQFSVLDTHLLLRSAANKRTRLRCLGVVAARTLLPRKLKLSDVDLYSSWYCVRFI